MKKPIAVIRIPKDHPALKGHKAGDMFNIGAQVPTDDEAAEAKVGAVGPEDEAAEQHVTLHARTLEKPPMVKQPKRMAPLDYLKNRSK